MEMKPFYNFQQNEETKITLLFDRPLEKEGQYGKYWIYKAVINGAEESFIANEKLHEALSFGKKNDVFTIKMVAEISNGKAYKHFIVSKPGISSQVAQKQIAGNVEKTEQEKWDRLGWGKCKTLFLVEAFKAGTKLDEAEWVAEAWADACMRKLEKSEWPDESMNVEDIFPN